jgi:hypothetical protein
MRRVRRRLGDGLGQNRRLKVIGQWLATGRPRLVSRHAFEAFIGKGLLPPPDRRLVLAGFLRGGSRAETARCRKDDLRQLDHLRGCVAICDEASKRLTLGADQSDCVRNIG